MVTPLLRAIRQSLVGVCYQGVCLLPEGSKPPVEIAMQWASEAESIKGISPSKK